MLDNIVSINLNTKDMLSPHIDDNINVKINNFTWTVEYKSPVSGILEGLRGICIYSERKIVLSNVLDYEYTLATLIHELTHAFEYAHGLRDRKTNEAVEDLAIFMECYASQIVDIARYIVRITKTDSEWAERN